MKVVRCLFFMLCLVGTTACANIADVISFDTFTFIEELRILEQFFPEETQPDQPTYEQFVETFVRLAQAYDHYVGVYQTDPTPETKEKIETILVILQQIQSWVKEFHTFVATTVEKNEPNQEEKPVTSPPQMPVIQVQTTPQQPGGDIQQQLLQMQQQQMMQQMMQNIMASMEQANDIMDDITRPNRLRRYKIIAYLVIGTIVVLGISACALYLANNAYGLYSAIGRDELDAQLENNEKIGKEAAEKARKLQEEVKRLSKENRLLRRSTKGAGDNVRNALDKQIVPLVENLDNRIEILNLLRRHKDDHEYIAAEIIGIIRDQNRGRQIIGKHQTEIEQLKQRVNRLGIEVDEQRLRRIARKEKKKRRKKRKKE